MRSTLATDSGVGVCLQTAPIRERWHTLTLILFRFAFIYLGLYSLHPISLSMQRTFHERLLFPALERFWVTLSTWTATHVLGFTDFNPRYLGGDSVVGYARVALLFLIAIAVTVIWSFIDRRRTQYVTLHEWLRLIIRVALGLMMIGYGMDKIVLGQMPRSARAN